MGQEVGIGLIPSQDHAIDQFMHKPSTAGVQTMKHIKQRVGLWLGGLATSKGSEVAK